MKSWYAARTVERGDTRLVVGIIKNIRFARLSRNLSKLFATGAMWKRKYWLTNLSLGSVSTDKDANSSAADYQHLLQCDNTHSRSMGEPISGL
mmetsp:Transcript_22191/g.52520  ORF Transcript_22191/g.52520 Transcript_22191/m.52520 type:complete len:93 (+) Transcript_22191:307-585(+)